MSFQPVVPFTGLAGWSFLQRTKSAQQATLRAQPVAQRDEAYFRAKIGSINTAEELVSDRRLLDVTLRAFGLEGDINNRFFIRKVLSDGTLKEGALANRLADKQYQKLSAAFGFGDFAIPRSKQSDFADKILAQYRDKQFETAVGQQNPDLRLALNAQRELPLLAKRNISEDTKWLTILGNVPLRRVVEAAFGLPSSFASIDLDQQLRVVKERSEQQFGTDKVSAFADPALTEKLVRKFLIGSEIAASRSSFSPAQFALQLLQTR